MAGPSPRDVLSVELGRRLADVSSVLADEPPASFRPVLQPSATVRSSTISSDLWDGGYRNALDSATQQPAVEVGMPRPGGRKRNVVGDPPAGALPHHQLTKQPLVPYPAPLVPPSP